METGPTPHLQGVLGDYAPTVLLPGDPKRARFIAENYLTKVKLVNSEKWARECLSLPLYPYMPLNEAKRVVNFIKKFYD